MERRWGAAPPLWHCARCSQCHKRLSRTHLALHQAIHGSGCRDIARDLGPDGRLVAGEHERQLRIEALEQPTRLRHARGRGLQLHQRPLLEQCGLQHEGLLKAQGLLCRTPLDVLLRPMDELEGPRIGHQSAIAAYRSRHGIIERRKRIEQHPDRLAELPGGHRRRRRVDRHRLLGPPAGALRCGLGVAPRVISLEQFIVGVGQLDGAAIVAHLAREDTAHPRLQIGLAPGLVEEGEGEDVAAIADRHLEDRPLAGPHRALLHGEHLGDDRDVLVHGELRECGQFPAQRVATGIVREQVADGGEAETLLEGCRGAPAEGCAELGVERGVHLSRVAAPSGTSSRYSQRSLRKITYSPMPTTSISPMAKGYPNNQCSSGITRKFIP
jgi:hypothetical protein